MAAFEVWPSRCHPASGRGGRSAPFLWRRAGMFEFGGFTIFDRKTSCHDEYHAWKSGMFYGFAGSQFTMHGHGHGWY
jgi:hypothetical protein